MRKLLSLLLCLALATAPVAAQNMPPDNTGGRTAHVQVSAGINAALNVVNPERPWLNAAACWAVGVAKEIADYRRGQEGYRHGLFSRQDLKSDALGCAIGWLAIAGGRLILSPRGFSLNWSN